MEKNSLNIIKLYIKTKDKEDNFLKALQLLNAFHLKVVLDEQFQQTEKATITQRDILEAYDEHNKNELIFDSVDNAMLKKDIWRKRRINQPYIIKIFGIYSTVFVFTTTT
ncbi:hypothetical protein MOV10_09040 [Salmonella enterica subsp. enterica serovar Abeokuta]|uniref:Uncharacterized protein n=1 Tax=Salmonella enterica subsp. enterica serovar Abeokuta TaxID=2926665 RepID=A0A8T9IQJ0_SALET|nr:hypothetical protein [Salmonella enterica]UNO35702.1 hypothetical protein MOV10_09040 [Salmonella enterica subsp. enterica serovar Abeokuta]